MTPNKYVDSILDDGESARHCQGFTAAFCYFEPQRYISSKNSSS